MPEKTEEQFAHTRDRLIQNVEKISSPHAQNDAVKKKEFNNAMQQGDEVLFGRNDVHLHGVWNF